MFKRKTSSFEKNLFKIHYKNILAFKKIVSSLREKCLASQEKNIFHLNR
jgi:hypothetical protein